nr:fumarylacetoacetate hydrolase family protein [Aestuariibacter salexigens]
MSPLVFIKANNAFNPSNHEVKIDIGLRTWGEPELAIVIGKPVYRVAQDAASQYIAGYTLANDVTCDDPDGRDHHLARSKSADGFCPILPFYDDCFQPDEQKITAFHNGELLRSAVLSDMIWNPAKIVSELSQWMTLEAGDIVLTGAPPRVRDRLFIQPGDIYRCEIEHLGSLETVFK